MHEDSKHPEEYPIATDDAPEARPFTRPAEPATLAAGGPSLLRQRPALNLTPLFVILAGGLVIGTILQQPTPSYCPNDASRWNTVYYLVEHGTYEYLPEHGAWWNTKQRGLFRDRLPFWTIDMVAQKDEAGNYHYYSSKPPLLPTLTAGVVLLLEKGSELIEPVTGPVLRWLSLKDDAKVATHVDFRIHLWFVMRTTLILTQAVPFMIFVWLIARHLTEQSISFFTAVFCTAVAALGTYLTPWTITYNNHVIAAFTAMFAAHAALRIWYDGRREWYWFAMAGFFAGLTATFELPAASLAVAILVALLVKDWRLGLAVGLPCLAVPVAAEMYTNYLALGTFAPAYSEFGVSGGLYDYPGSYWLEPGGMDALDERKHIYLMHLLVGHHGFFLLTPILLVSLIGLGRHLRRAGLAVAGLVSLVLLAGVALVVTDIALQGQIASSVEQALAGRLTAADYVVPRGWPLLAPLAVLLLINFGMYLPEAPRPKPMLALLTFAMSAVVIGFYTVKTNNYGGGAQGARWLFWLIPFWVLMLPAGVEWVARSKAGRVLCYSLLIVSMITVAFAFRLPWSDSWAHLLFRNLGWIKY